MKKIFLIIIGLFMFLPLTVGAVTLPEKTDHEKVTIYIFRGHGCSHCYEALEFFYENNEKYNDYFEVVTYEVWKNEDNGQLMQEVGSAFGDDVDGVPYIVIGSDYSNTKGFSTAISEDIVTAALKAYQDEEYVDLVAQKAKEIKGTVSKNLEDSCREEGIIPGKYDVIIIFSILLVVVGGGAVLIKFARKS